MNKGIKQEAQKLGMKPKTIYQRRWLKKNRERWNSYKRSLYIKRRVPSDWVLDMIKNMA